MRPVLFFIVVFSVLLLALYLSVEKSPPETERAKPVASDVTGPAPAPRDDLGNTIDLPFYDVQKGRLAYRLRGELPSDVFKFADIQEPKHYLLRHGRLEIPIYDEVAEAIPRGIERISRIDLHFDTAEYREVPKGRTGMEQLVHLSGGGEGRADDGSVITFEEMEVRIEKADQYVYTIRSAKPIAIRNSAIEMWSPNGLEGTIRGDTDLERITFAPPVVTFIDARSAELFSLKAPEVEGGSAPKIAITSAGPLVLDRTATPPRIEFRDDVKIFPVEEPSQTATAPDGELPAPGATWFHCQTLAILIEDDGEGPPELSEAVATWDGGRVRASYEGLLAEGGTLRWKRLDPSSGGDTGTLESEAVLDGRPSFRGEQTELEADVARFRLHENTIVLEGTVDGVLQRVVDSTEKEPDGPAKPADDLPGRWAFSADRVVVVLDDRAGADAAGGADAGDARRPEGARRKRQGALEGIASLVASAAEDDGLELWSVGDRSLMLRGRELRFDGHAQAATFVGGTARPPRLMHGSSEGSAERLLLFLEEDTLRLEGDVVLRLSEEEMRGLERPGPPDAAGAAAVPEGAPEGRGAPGAGDGSGGGVVAEPLRGGLEFAGDRLDVRFDEARKIRSAIAVSLGQRPIVLRPLPPGAEYRIEGPGLTWDNEARVAVMEAPEGATPGTALWPSLEFRGGLLTAGRIRFTQDAWTADLDRGVVIRGRRRAVDGEKGDGEAEGREAGEPLAIVSDRARVEFFERFERRGPASPAECHPELESVHRIHAWSDPGGKLRITARAYSGEAGEATWESESQELRLLGEGEQVFTRTEGETADVLRAGEIAYRRAAGLIRLERGARGRFYLEAQRIPGGIGPTDSASADATRVAGGRPSLAWDYETDWLELAVRETPDCRGLELLGISARDRVLLVCESEGIRLRGDDLLYDRASQEIRIFSRDGRYQNLSQESAEPGGAVKLNKIDSREILVRYREQEDSGDPARREQIVVKFFDDVTAAFEAPPDLNLPIRSASREEADEWKLRSDYLGLKILPGLGRAKAVQAAYAEGEVIFTSADMKAMAREAIYQEEASRLVLRGGGRSNVQLSTGGRSISSSVVILSRQGPKWQLRSRDKDDRSVSVDPLLPREDPRR